MKVALNTTTLTQFIVMVTITPTVRLLCSIICLWFLFLLVLYNFFYIKPAHAVTSIKQPPVLKGHLFLAVIENFIWSEPLLRGHLSYNVTFSLSQRRPLSTGLTVNYFLFTKFQVFLCLPQSGIILRDCSHDDLLSILILFLVSYYNVLRINLQWQ